MRLLVIVLLLAGCEHEPDVSLELACSVPDDDPEVAYHICRNGVSIDICEGYDNAAECRLTKRLHAHLRNIAQLEEDIHAEQEMLDLIRQLQSE